MHQATSFTRNFNSFFYCLLIVKEKYIADITFKTLRISFYQMLYYKLRIRTVISDM